MSKEHTLAECSLLMDAEKSGHSVDMLEEFIYLLDSEKLISYFKEVYPSDNHYKEFCEEYDINDINFQKLISGKRLYNSGLVSIRNYLIAKFCDKKHQVETGTFHTTTNQMIKKITNSLNSSNNSPCKGIVFIDADNSIYCLKYISDLAMKANNFYDLHIVIVMSKGMTSNKLIGLETRHWVSIIQAATNSKSAVDIALQSAAIALSLELDKIDSDIPFFIVSADHFSEESVQQLTSIGRGRKSFRIDTSINKDLTTYFQNYFGGSSEKSMENHIIHNNSDLAHSTTTKLTHNVKKALEPIIPSEKPASSSMPLSMANNEPLSKIQKNLYPTLPTPPIRFPVVSVNTNIDTLPNRFSDVQSRSNQVMQPLYVRPPIVTTLKPSASVVNPSCDNIHTYSALTDEELRKFYHDNCYHFSSHAEFCRRYGNIDSSNFSKWRRGLKSSPASRNAVLQFKSDIESGKLLHNIL
ncbi:hypothetical protein C9374_002193 [Naegleria lovaniensis]|uniref:Uncharacterized protein n=1 Tax=Naegleria lovaniensis TaxID=51637 RepID=A0AA88GVF8_NAELO|nr:uncharacterized protein C9374_002193 [Naegleria lovaniensis]KAG2386449.1 hypothetical protein C9374_002193 [Naegleria lovaniensis]